MKDRSLIFFVVGALLLVVFSFSIFQYRHTRINAPVVEGIIPQNTAGPKAVQFIKKGTYPSFVSGTMEPGNIRLELSPEGFKNSAFKVRFFANAHDMVLEPYDLAQMTTLQYEGRLLKPSHTDRMKGHHDSGLMYFDIGKSHDPDSLATFSITVKGLPRDEVRVFNWE